LGDFGRFIKNLAVFRVDVAFFWHFSAFHLLAFGKLVGIIYIGGSIHLEARPFFRVWVKWLRRMGKMSKYFTSKFYGYEQNGLRGL
jgi:hypothetical protein